MKFGEKLGDIVSIRQTGHSIAIIRDLIQLGGTATSGWVALLRLGGAEGRG